MTTLNNPAPAPLPPTTTPQRTRLLANRDQPAPGTDLRSYLKRLRSGDLGPLPIIVGLIIIAIIFQSQNDNFLTARNFVNLIPQMAGITAIAYGVVFILLLGEIDLSVGYVSAVAAVSMTLLMLPPTNAPWYVAVVVGLVVAAGVGLLHGLLITTFQVPSFVVTLAGLLGWNGVVLRIIGNGGTVIIQDQTIIGVANTYLSPELGWLVAIIFVGLYTLSVFLGERARGAQGLAARPPYVIGLRVAVLAVLIFATVAVCNESRGVPFVGVLLLVMLVGLSFVAEQTRFGRYVYAIGGSKEAARRAGINVERYRIYVFMISSVMAGVGGIILASRLRSVDTNAGGGNLLLYSIAAAVIGGTSLFGGRGKVSSALLGALVIASVDNGMGLLGLSSGDKFIVTGLVLLAAVIVDSVSRRSQKRSGLV